LFNLYVFTSNPENYVGISGITQGFSHAIPEKMASRFCRDVTQNDRVNGILISDGYLGQIKISLSKPVWFKQKVQLFNINKLLIN
jgi:hypothetical protein